MVRANNLSQFTFRQVASGAYMVLYKTQIRGDYWVNRIDYMPIIDATKNAEWPKVSDIKELRNMVKQGTHYSKHGECIN